jgi:GTPase SAR1 family protein
MGIGFTKSRTSPVKEAQNRQLQAEILRSREIDQMTQKQHNKTVSVVKLLLLGAGESGKSTLFKQIVGIYGKGWKSIERDKFTEAVHTNTLASIQALCKYSDIFNAKGMGTAVLPENVAIKDSILGYRLGSKMINSKIAEMIKTLWRDPGIQKTYTLRSNFQLLDSAEYLFSRVDAICESNYIPNEQDVLRVRVKTTGIIETDFQVMDSKFKLFDVGGQRSERKKWINCFDDVTAVLFLAALSEYDQVLEEDGVTNRMSEALDLFNQICNEKCLKDTALILFLNKSDIFVEKLKKVSISVFDPKYEGPPNDYEASITHIESLFRAQNKNKNREIYSHITCATDQENVKKVFLSVRDIIIRQSLVSGGLI